MPQEKINPNLESLCVDVATLHEDPKNARMHGDENLDAIAASLGHFGQQKPIVVKPDGTVIAGNGTYRCALRLGWKQIAVVRFDGDPDAAAKAYTIADNRTAELATWDNRILAQTLQELEKLNLDVSSITGFSSKELERIACYAPENPGESDPDEVPAVPETPVTQPGDLWEMGGPKGHRLLCGDSTKPEDVAKVMNGKKAGLMNTDPPYGIDYSKTKDGIPGSGFKDYQKQWGDIKNDGLADKKLQEFLEAVFRAACPHLKNAAWYLWHAHLTQGFFAAAAAAAAADVILHRQIIWKKPGFVLTRSGMYHWAHEPAFFGWRKGEQPPWYGSKSQKSVWEIGRDNDRGQHPTQKPIALFEIPILNHLREGELCYEPFAGSGSQFIAAEKLGRRCYGLEIEGRYVQVCLERWAKFTGKQLVLLRTGETFAQVKARCADAKA